MQKMPNVPADQPAKLHPIRNTISIGNSAAFRKANHDAMEAVKATVTKLKAERERFFREEGKDRKTSFSSCGNNRSGGTEGGEG